MLGKILSLRAQQSFEELEDEQREFLSILERILDGLLDASGDGHDELKVRILLSKEYQTPRAGKLLARNAQEEVRKDTSLKEVSIQYRDEDDALRVHIMWGVAHG
jgi:hypothetical protein